MAQPQPSPTPREESPLNKGLSRVKSQIDQMLEKMQQQNSYIPERQEVEKFSSEALELIRKHHPQMEKERKTLLMAVIDLTEIPVMHPKMQRVAFQTALKDASSNLEEFLSQG